MHPEKVTVWSGLWAGGIIGSYFFYNAVNRKVTSNGERYSEMIQEFDLLDIQQSGVISCGAMLIKPIFIQTASSDVLEDQIEVFIRDIPTEILERICQNRT